MPNTGFWSYVHADDDAEQGRITQLAEDLAGQYEAITGEAIELFLDRASLGWGDDWNERIEETIIRTAFFVPIVSPRYLASEACRRELQLFARNAEALGYRELVMPLLWFDVPELADPEPTDDLVILIKRYQWDDWRDRRFEERASGEYRRAVASLAQRLAAVNARLTAAPPEPPEAMALDRPTLDEDDDQPGSLDLMAAAMTALPAWTDTVNLVGVEIQAVSALAEAATEEMEKGEGRGKDFAVRLTVARNFGRNLEPHAQRLEELGNQFTTHMYDVDAGIRTMVAQAETEVRADPALLPAVCTFFESIRTMAESSAQGLGGLQSMVDSIAPVEGLSRDMRSPLRKMRKALTVMVEGQTVIDDWVKLIDASSIDCSEHVDDGAPEARS